MAVMSRDETEALIQEVLEIYPEKAKQDRAKHLTANDHEAEQSKKCITSNKKSLPGVMTIRASGDRAGDCYVALCDDAFVETLIKDCPPET